MSAFPSTADLLRVLPELIWCGFGALLMLLQPFVSSRLLQSICRAFLDGNGESVVAAHYGDSPGIPALFARKKFPDLLELHGDRGAKKIILESTSVHISAPEAEFDIDTEADLQRCASNSEYASGKEFACDNR